MNVGFIGDFLYPLLAAERKQFFSGSRVAAMSSCGL